MSHEVYINTHQLIKLNNHWEGDTPRCQRLQLVVLLSRNPRDTLSIDLNPFIPSQTGIATAFVVGERLVGYRRVGWLWWVWRRGVRGRSEAGTLGLRVVEPVRYLFQ